MSIFDEIKKLEPFIDILGESNHEWEPPQGIQFPEIGPEEELVPINEKIFRGLPPILTIRKNYHLSMMMTQTSLKTLLKSSTKISSVTIRRMNILVLTVQD